MRLRPGFFSMANVLGALALILLLGFCLGAGGGRARIDPRAGGGFRLHAAGAPLWMVLTELRRRTGIEVAGLEKRHGQTVVLDAGARTAEGMLKRLLRHLGEHNFALEYRGGRLARATVFPSVQGRAGGLPAAEADPANITVPVVRVQRVFQGSQAQKIGLENGDFIIAYNSTLIRHHSELIEATRQSDPEDLVDLVIARDYATRRLAIGGGTIGIGVRTIRIFKEEYDVYAEAIP